MCNSDRLGEAALHSARWGKENLLLDALYVLYMQYETDV